MKYNLKWLASNQTDKLCACFTLFISIDLKGSWTLAWALNNIWKLTWKAEANHITTIRVKEERFFSHTIVVCLCILSAIFP